jgi:hypothetical protein
MAAKKRRKRGPGLLWRVLFGHNGPTRGELRKLLGLTFSKTFTLNVRDPATGRVQKKRMRIGDDGRIQEVKAPAKKKVSAAKRPAAKKATARRTASKPSKPSRTSKAGATPRRQAQPGGVPAAARRAKPVPLAERVRRNPDGTLNGSRRDPATQERQRYAQAQREYAQAMKNAAAAGRRAEYLLGWQQQPAPRRRSS